MEGIILVAGIINNFKCLILTFELKKEQQI